MPHRSEQATLFELSPGEGLEPVDGLGFESDSTSAIHESAPPTSEGNVAPTEPAVFRAVSPWAFCYREQNGRTSHSVRPARPVGARSAEEAL